MNEQNNDKYREYKKQIIHMFEYLPIEERNKMIADIVTRFPMPSPKFLMVENLTEDDKVRIKQEMDKLYNENPGQLIFVNEKETNLNFDREKLEQALAAVINARTMDEAIEDFRRHMGITTYSDPENPNIIAFASIGHNARVSDFVVDDRQQLELSLILQELKKLLDELYPNWGTLNLELKDKIKENIENNKLYCVSCGDLVISGKILHWFDGNFIFCDDDMRYKDPEQLKHYTLIKDGKIIREEN